MSKLVDERPALAADAAEPVVQRDLAVRAIGLVGAAAPLIAAELGRRRHAVRQVRRAFRMAVWLAVGAGLGTMAILGTLQIWMVLVAGVIIGIGEAFFERSASSISPGDASRPVMMTCWKPGRFFRTSTTSPVSIQPNFMG